MSIVHACAVRKASLYAHNDYSSSTVREVIFVALSSFEISVQSLDLKCFQTPNNYIEVHKIYCFTNIMAYLNCPASLVLICDEENSQYCENWKCAQEGTPVCRVTGLIYRLPVLTPCMSGASLASLACLIRISFNIIVTLGQPPIVNVTKNLHHNDAKCCQFHLLIIPATNELIYKTWTVYPYV